MKSQYLQTVQVGKSIEWTIGESSQEIVLQIQDGQTPETQEHVSRQLRDAVVTQIPRNVHREAEVSTLLSKQWSYSLVY